MDFSNYFINKCAYACTHDKFYGQLIKTIKYKIASHGTLVSMLYEALKTIQLGG